MVGTDLVVWQLPEIELRCFSGVDSFNDRLLAFDFEDDIDYHDNEEGSDEPESAEFLFILFFNITNKINFLFLCQSSLFC